MKINRYYIEVAKCNIRKTMYLINYATYLNFNEYRISWHINLYSFFKYCFFEVKYQLIFGSLRINIKIKIMRRSNC
jgi:hypothetical protein